VRVLKLFDGDYPWDVRVEKVAAALAAAGHEVRLLCRNRAARARWARDPMGFEIARLPALPGPLTFPFFLNPVGPRATQASNFARSAAGARSAARAARALARPRADR
jgi:hypothetical protein